MTYECTTARCGRKFTSLARLDAHRASVHHDAEAKKRADKRNAALYAKAHRYTR